MAMRTAPTVAGSAPAGTKAWAVPVVPHSAAAMRTGKTPGGGFGMKLPRDAIFYLRHLY